jgi:hypothetical protein
VLLEWGMGLLKLPPLVAPGVATQAPSPAPCYMPQAATRLPPPSHCLFGRAASGGTLRQNSIPLARAGVQDPNGFPWQACQAAHESQAWRGLAHGRGTTVWLAQE